MSTYTKAESETRRARSRWAAPASLTARTSHHKIENLYGYLSATKRLLNGIEATARATRHNATAHFAGRRAGGYG